MNNWVLHKIVNIDETHRASFRSAFFIEKNAEHICEKING